MRRAALCALLGLTACALEDADLEQRTAHLNLGSRVDAPLCLGTVRAAELEAERIQLLLGTTPGPSDVYLGIDAVRENCIEGATGCAYFGEVVYTDFPSLSHELVHAYAQPTDLPFLEEGLAEALSGGAWKTSTSGVAEFEARARAR
ncbi:hypothetical protein G6O69_36065 [Pseudenhygromyxa sp. WMMC2535]|uniref:hypothetical protein n=1 Tax=Pseudenhygromyxa sp. WMMC2535 TaxID=2712867 RepID=UPI001555B921|nr:hypothetical protein [Pseudenhygromyxa sp. WMMC2535]NVB43297.1 hypothetical protein [Pseudenhygromyxa sp. WMMC2535]